MRCPYCDHPDSKILETRADPDASATRRRRRCPSCDGRFYTSERLDTAPLVVAKRDGTREDFDRKRLVDSLNLGKTSLTTSKRDAIADAVIARLKDRGPLVTSYEIGEAILNCLRGVDIVAHARYALFFRRPKDPAEFQEWLAENSTDEGRQELQQDLFVVHRDGTKEPFDTRRLRVDLFDATRGRDSIDDSRIEQEANIIEQRLRRLASAAPDGSFQVTPSTIGEEILNRLRAMDPLAYLSYALVFRGIDSYGKLSAELRNLTSQVSRARKPREIASELLEGA